MAVLHSQQWQVIGCKLLHSLGNIAGSHHVRMVQPENGSETSTGDHQNQGKHFLQELHSLTYSQSPREVLQGYESFKKLKY